MIEMEIFTIDNFEVGFPISLVGVRKFFGNGHVLQNGGFQVVNGSTEILLHVFWVQIMQHLFQLRHAAVVECLLLPLSEINNRSFRQKWSIT